ncbi:MAG: DUF488 family protein [Acidobacteriota bacterium]
MTVKTVQLGTARLRDEGVRMGRVRRPPRGVPRSQYAKGDWYDVWLPNLAPSQELMKAGRASTTASEWKAFVRRFRAEMNKPEASHVLDALAALSHSANFSVGCYCVDEAHCHRSVLRELLAERHAKIE